MTRKPPARDRAKSFSAELLRGLQELITRGLSDPRITGLLTVTEVDVSPDLKVAVVKVSVLPEKNETKVLAGLTHAAAHIRHQLGDLLDSDRLPTLRFAIDRGPKQQAAVIAALSLAARERAQRDAAAPPALDQAPHPANNPSVHPDQAPH